jgi:hypothetical protein
LLIRRMEEDCGFGFLFGIFFGLLFPQGSSKEGRRIKIIYQCVLSIFIFTDQQLVGLMDGLVKDGV